jgi:hypothetical protein
MSPQKNCCYLQSTCQINLTAQLLESLRSSWVISRSVKISGHSNSLPLIRHEHTSISACCAKWHPASTVTIDKTKNEWTKVHATAHHLSLSRTRWIQSTNSYPVYLRTILISSCHLYHDLQSCPSTSGSSFKILYAFLPPQTHATWPKLSCCLGLTVGAEPSFPWEVQERVPADCDPTGTSWIQNAESHCCTATDGVRQQPGLDSRVGWPTMKPNGKFHAQVTEIRRVAGTQWIRRCVCSRASQKCPFLQVIEPRMPKP